MRGGKIIQWPLLGLYIVGHSLAEVGIIQMMGPPVDTGGEVRGGRGQLAGPSAGKSWTGVAVMDVARWKAGGG